MSQAGSARTPWITHPDMGEGLVQRLVWQGLGPGEALQDMSWGSTPVTTGDLAREARALGERALDGLRTWTARDVASGVATMAAITLADSVLHTFGALPPYQSVGESIGHASPGEGSAGISQPPSHHGYVLLLTSARLLLLDVVSCIPYVPSGVEPVRWFALQDVFAFGRPLPSSADIRFEWVRVLWERQLDMHIGLRDGRRRIRFGSFGIANAPARAAAIAQAIGKAPMP